MRPSEKITLAFIMLLAVAVFLAPVIAEICLKM